MRLEHTMPGLQISGYSFRTAVPTVTLTLSYKDFGAQSMAWH